MKRLLVAILVLGNLGFVAFPAIAAEDGWAALSCNPATGHIILTGSFANSTTAPLFVTASDGSIPLDPAQGQWIAPANTANEVFFILDKGNVLANDGGAGSVTFSWDDGGPQQMTKLYTAMSQIEFDQNCGANTTAPNPSPSSVIFQYRVIVHNPFYRYGTFGLTFPSGTQESDIHVAVHRRCGAFDLRFTQSSTLLLAIVVEIPNSPHVLRTTLTVKVNDGSGWRLKTFAFALVC